MGCSHHTIKVHVDARAQGRTVGTPIRRDPVTDEFMDKITELVARSGGRIRADTVHQRLTTLGYQRSERSTRRAAAEAKQVHEKAGRRVHLPGSLSRSLSSSLCSGLIYKYGFIRSG